MQKILEIIELEKIRQKETLMMIASENYTYPEVRSAVGSALMHKYSEGYPGKRYYQGNKYVDEIELLCQKNALDLFSLDGSQWSVNVQALSGTPANLAILNALLNPGDKILSMYLYDGGHLSHGWSYKGKNITLTSKIYDINFYYVDPKTGVFDYKKIRDIALKTKPKLIISGGTAYAPEIDYKELSLIAKEVGAYYLADVSHEAGLIAGGSNTSPFKYADCVMMTTHKTLRGPRGALIFSKKELSPIIDASVFPGIQGGPHNEIIAGIAIALEKAKTSEFRKYAAQTVANAKALAMSLQKKGLSIVSKGTSKHLILVDLQKNKVSGWFIAWALEVAGIIVNRSTVPADPASPYYPSGIRLGTQALTVRGMKEQEMDIIADFISKVVSIVGEREIPQNQDERKKVLSVFRNEIIEDKSLKDIKSQVEKLCRDFPIDL